MKLKNIILLLIMIVFLTLALLSCSKQEKSEQGIVHNDSASLEIEDTPGSSVADRSSSTLDEILALSKYPFGVAEIEIVDIIPRDTYDKFATESLPNMSNYVFYNAKITNMHFADESFEESIDFIFKHDFYDEFQNFNSGDRFICLLFSVEDEHGPQFKNVYGAYFGNDSIFDIKTLNDEEIIILRSDTDDNLFNLDLPISQKQEIDVNIDMYFERDNISNTSRFLEEKYIAYYDDFITNIVNHVKNYRTDNSIVEESAFQSENFNTSAELSNVNDINLQDDHESEQVIEVSEDK